VIVFAHAHDAARLENKGCAAFSRSRREEKNRRRRKNRARTCGNYLQTKFGEKKHRRVNQLPSNHDQDKPNEEMTMAKKVKKAAAKKPAKKVAKKSVRKAAARKTTKKAAKKPAKKTVAKKTVRKAAKRKTKKVAAPPAAM
jgi:hypothetical protein